MQFTACIQEFPPPAHPSGAVSVAERREMLSVFYCRSSFDRQPYDSMPSARQRHRRGHTKRFCAVLLSSRPTNTTGNNSFRFETGLLHLSRRQYGFRRWSPTTALISLGDCALYVTKTVIDKIALFNHVYLTKSPIAHFMHHALCCISCLHHFA